MLKGMDWGKEQETGCSKAWIGEKNKEQDAQRRGLGKRTRNRMFNDTDFRKEKRKLARFLKEM